tara:strand:+ start:307 stop:579 length:273 start_codon:yes stop_codon:yes gene_type:complete
MEEIHRGFVAWRVAWAVAQVMVRGVPWEGASQSPSQMKTENICGRSQKGKNQKGKSQKGKILAHTKSNRKNPTNDHSLFNKLFFHTLSTS